RLVEQKQRQIGYEAARDVDALLFAARERRRRQRPQPLRYVESTKEIGRAPPGIVPLDSRDHQRLGHDIDRRHAWNGAQKLADIAERTRAQLENLARLCSGDVDGAAIGMQAVASRVAAVGGADHLQGRALAPTRT